MKKLFMALLVSISFSAASQSGANQEWETISESTSGDLVYLYKKDSDQTYKLSSGFETRAMFSRAKDKSQSLVTVTVKHKDCVAKFGTYTVRSVSDKSMVYSPEFALGRPNPTIGDGVAEHLCKLALRYQVIALAERKKQEIDYRENQYARTLFDLMMNDVMKSSLSSNKDLDEVMEEVHGLVKTSMTAK